MNTTLMTNITSNHTCTGWFTEGSFDSLQTAITVYFAVGIVLFSVALIVFGGFVAWQLKTIAFNASKTREIIVALLGVSCIFQILQYAIDPFRRSCRIPIFFDRIFNDMAFIFCLIAYFILIHLWSWIQKRISKLKSRSLKNYPHLQKLVLYMTGTLIVPDIILRIIQQAGFPDFSFQFTFDAIFYIYFAIFVLCLNMFFVWKGYLLISGLDFKTSNSESIRETMIFHIKIMSGGTLILSTVFVTFIVVSVSLKWWYNVVTWLVVEIILHGCYFFALILEFSSIFILVKSETQSRSSQSGYSTPRVSTNSNTAQEPHK